MKSLCKKLLYPIFILVNIRSLSSFGWLLWEDNNPSYFKGYNRPVEQVSWNETQEFIKKLNKLSKLKYRLLTEAEWEYAARGGEKSLGFKYAGSNKLKDVAWFSEVCRQQ
jgi:formylglycine-generating enzyme required for sulfatase activity